MTVGQIRKVCKKHKYIILRDYSGRQIGVNCGVIDLMLNRLYPDYYPSKYQSYRAADIHEYIQFKKAFI